MRALVIGDDPNLCALWGGVFGEIGFETTRAQSTADARMALHSNRFDLVLLDVSLNCGDGESIAVLAGERNPGCNVVIVTGAAGPAKDELLLLAPNVGAVLRKPVNIEELVSVCGYLIGEAETPLPRLIRGVTDPRADLEHGCA